MTELTTSSPDQAATKADTPTVGESAPKGQRTPTRRRFGRALLAALLLGLIGTCAYLTARPVYGYYHLRAARAAVERYQTRQAREHLEPCLIELPDNAEALFLAARNARRMKAFPEAEQLLREYHRVRGEDDDLTLERVLLRAEQGDVDAVSKFGRKLVSEDDPRSGLVLEALTAGYLRGFRLDEAEFCLDRWFERDPDNVQAHVYRGTLHELRVQTLEAVKAYRKAVDLDPDHDEARRRLAASLLELVQAAEALPHLQYLRRHLPHDLAVAVDLARCLDQLGEQDQAAKLLDELLQRNPNYAPAVEERGLLAMREGRVAEAEPWLRKASTLSPGSYQTQYQYFLCLRQLGKVEEAQRVDARAKQIEADRKRFDELVRMDMQRSPHDPALHHELGLIALRAGSVQEGLRWFESALQKDPNHEPAHRDLAILYQNLGQTGRAARHIELARPRSGARPAAPGAPDGEPGR